MSSGEMDPRELSRSTLAGYLNNSLLAGVKFVLVSLSVDIAFYIKTMPSFVRVHFEISRCPILR